MPKKLTIEQMVQFAKKNGGFCLSKTYINTNTELEWECKEGHIWKAIPKAIKNGTWCQICIKENKLKKLQDVAESRGGKCLSENYINNCTKLEWECSEGHIWKANPGEVKNKKTWCPICAESRKRNKLNKLKKKNRNILEMVKNE